MESLNFVILVRDGLVRRALPCRGHGIRRRDTNYQLGEYNQAESLCAKGQAKRRSMRCSRARRIQVSVVSGRASESLLSRRHRPRPPKVRSTPQRRGSTAKPWVPGGRDTISTVQPTGSCTQAAQAGPRYPASAQRGCNRG